MTETILLAIIIIGFVLLIGLYVVAYTEWRIRQNKAELYQIMDEWLRIEHDPKVTYIRKHD